MMSDDVMVWAPRAKKVFLESEGPQPEKVTGKRMVALRLCVIFN